MTYQLICRGKRLVFHLSPRDGHVITVSGCLILTAVNSFSYRWLTKSLKFLQDVTFDISLHEVCLRVGVRYVITKFSATGSLPNFLAEGAPQARASRARAPLLCKFKKLFSRLYMTFSKSLEKAGKIDIGL